MTSGILEQLYVRYYKSAFLYTLSLCKNRDLADDIVADSFVKAYLSFPDNHTSFNYWLLRVCKNLWLDYLRRQKRNADDCEDAFSDISKEDSPEENLLRDERLSTLYNCIRLLQPAEQEVLILHYFSNLPLREIALILNVTPGSIKTRVFRARKNLKNLMEDNGYDF